jgi:beta-glucosidase
VAWPFGYGLSYITFDYQNLKIEGEPSTADQSISLSFEVKNTGQMAGDEIAQIYLSPTTDEQQIRPIQLQGFARVTLQPGESKTVKVKLYTEQLGFYSHQDQHQWNIVPGKYIIKVGASSADIRLQEELTLKGESVSKPLRDYYFSETTIQ